MSFAKLLALSVERFKSFEVETRMEIAPLTVILGRNNSGKSSLIQSLLLLKQTVNDPRPDVMLRLEGVIDALNLRELTFGWPPAADNVEGPSFTLEWESVVDLTIARNKAHSPDLDEVARNSGVDWLRSPDAAKAVHTKIRLETRESGGVAQVHAIALWSTRDRTNAPSRFGTWPLLKLVWSNDKWQTFWRGEPANALTVDLQHFIPLLLIDRRNLGPRHRQRAWHTAYLMLFEQPLADLTAILSELHFLGAGRQPPATLYKAATAAPNEIGMSGELAAQLLHRRQHDLVHFLPPLEINAEGALAVPESVRVRSMVNAVNDVMSALSITAPVTIQEVQDIGFRLLFGHASLMHVGRGLNSLLPLVEVGLIADPLRFTGGIEDMPLETYQSACATSSFIALEEPEAHLHPKVASRLAHWLVSLAMTNRQLIVETHSDHLVRRLRGLAARAGTGTALEQWLLNNVVIVSVDQDNGRSSIVTSRLTSEGGVAENWPADFMDEATNEESAIYYAKLDKHDEPAAAEITFEEGPEPELEAEP